MYIGLNYLFANNQKDDADRELIKKAQGGDAAAADKIVAAYLRWGIKRGRSINSGIPHEDLINEVVLALIQAIRDFNLASNNGFGGYARHRIKDRLTRAAEKFAKHGGETWLDAPGKYDDGEDSPSFADSMTASIWTPEEQEISCSLLNRLDKTEAQVFRAVLAGPDRPGLWSLHRVGRDDISASGGETGSRQDNAWPIVRPRSFADRRPPLLSPDIAARARPQAWEQSRRAGLRGSVSPVA